MITTEKVEEWIREVAERPSSAPAIIRFIAKRLEELSVTNGALLDENIQLRSGKKIEAYEQRIANLEYQLGLLKRQLAEDATSASFEEKLCLLAYNASGQALRIDLDREQLVSRAALARFDKESITEEIVPRLLVTNEQEELLFLFDSGQTAQMPVSAIPVVDPNQLSWDRAVLQGPPVGAELAAIIPIAKMSLFDFCVQASRRGFVKKIAEIIVESHLAKGYIGSGVIQPSDKTCSLTLCNKNDQYVKVSQSGVLLCMAVGDLPITIEQALRLEADDHVVSAFRIAQEPGFLAVTQTGKAIHRETSWLEPAGSLKSKGQPIFSQARRASGVRVVGAAPVGSDDWGVALQSDGLLVAHKVEDLFASGSLFGSERSCEILSFTTFSWPD